MKMLKVALILGFVAVATALPSLKLPGFDEAQVRQAYTEDEEEARTTTSAIPHDYPGDDADEGTVVDIGMDPIRSEPTGKNKVASGVSSLYDSYYATEVMPVSWVMPRDKRSLQPGAPDYGVGGGQDRNWGTDVRKDGPNTKVSIDGKHKGEDYDVEGQWSKVVRGPGKAKPDWRVGVKW